MKNITSIMNPLSIAVVGATNRPGSVGLHVFPQYHIRRLQRRNLSCKSEGQVGTGGEGISFLV